jgi:hypothetical protein
MKSEALLRYYKRIEFNAPCPESHMHGRNDGNYPCHILRQIYEMTDSEEIKMKLRIVTTMVRKMSYRLPVTWEVLWREHGA